MRVCVLHAARDLRIEERPVDRLGPDEVRVRFGAGGICGSDLHYYLHGRVGDFAVREPLILGHEMAGDVVETGPGVTRVRVGDRVAVNPSLPCWACRACQAGRTNLCRRMTFFGSAAVMPHGSFPQGGIQIPGHRLMSKEIELAGAFRFHDEFATAVRLLIEGRVDVAPLLTGQFPMAERDLAFETAADRTRAMKVQLTF
jgi:threonine dehydrogenase-like Zn-dependent dehydrogenase